jgi:hypothetical protein
LRRTVVLKPMTKLEISGFGEKLLDLTRPKTSPPIHPSVLASRFRISSTDISS